MSLAAAIKSIFDDSAMQAAGFSELFKDATKRGEPLPYAILTCSGNQRDSVTSESIYSTAQVQIDLYGATAAAVDGYFKVIQTVFPEGVQLDLSGDGKRSLAMRLANDHTLNDMSDPNIHRAVCLYEVILQSPVTP